ILDWLELYPGTTWQQRWDASGTETDVTIDWRSRMVADLETAGKAGSWNEDVRPRIGAGLGQLIAGDVIRPGLRWLLTTPSPARVSAEMGRTRDPSGIAALRALEKSSNVGKSTFGPAVEKVGVIMAAKGGLVADITPGDCIELMDACLAVF